MEDIFQNMMTKKTNRFYITRHRQTTPTHKSFCKERANIITNLNYSKLI